MNLQQALKKLQSMGTARNRKVYPRHGVGENLYGVSYANLNKLKKEIKIDHELANRLWETGNHDAMVLANMISDPELTTIEELEARAENVNNYVITDSLVGFISQTEFIQELAERWIKSENEWIGRAGWGLVAHLAIKNEQLPDEYFEKLLSKIQKTIHEGKNKTRDAMNSALIAIGIRNSHLEGKAILAAQKIGKIEVDHGQTSCKTPDAVSCIEKSWKRKR